MTAHTVITWKLIQSIDVFGRFDATAELQTQAVDSNTTTVLDLEQHIRNRHTALSSGRLLIYTINPPLEPQVISDILSRQQALYDLGDQFEVESIKFTLAKGYRMVKGAWDQLCVEGKVNALVVSFKLDNQNSHILSAVENSDLVKEFSSSFIKVSQWGGFSQNDLGLNKVVQWDNKIPVPSFVQALQTRLSRKVFATPKDVGVLDSDRDLSVWQAYVEPAAMPAESVDSSARHQHLQSSAQQQSSTEVVNATSARDEKGAPRRAQPREIRHILLHQDTWEDMWTQPPIIPLESLASLFFSPIVFHVRKLQQGENPIDVGQNVTSPLTFVAYKEDASIDDRLRQFTPRSDFTIIRSSIPRLLAETDSAQLGDEHIGKYRMNLTGKAIVQLMNQLSSSYKEKKNFVLVTIYIEQTGSAIVSFMFQKQIDQDDTVYCYSTPYKLNTGAERASFLLLLYNFVYELQGPLDAAKSDLLQYTECFDQFCRTVYNMAYFTGKRQRKPDGDGGDGDQRGGSKKQKQANQSNQDSDLTTHGYELDPDDDDILVENGFVMEKIFQFPSNLLRIVSVLDRDRKLVAKKLPFDSSEMRTLTFLRSLRPPSNHIIPIIDLFNGHDFAWAVFPSYEYTLQSYIAFNPITLARGVSSVCEGFLKGFAFLHEHHVAHCDIKPANILLDGNLCPKVIDFGLALILTSDDDEINEYGGTEGWIAPEVEQEWPSFKPIKADRWSCGHLIHHLLEKLLVKDDTLATIATNLEVDDPDARPSLSHCVGMFLRGPVPVP
ncbi:hypothetical protein ONZ45_g13389 [Pleurotus djamor]|nr:hypothetical protein ONZ45_g13389 [Pleurotus djamor]